MIAGTTTREGEGVNKNETREALAALMDRHELTESDVANMLGVSLWTVQGWRKPDTSRSARRCQPAFVEQLRARLGLGASVPFRCHRCRRPTRSYAHVAACTGEVIEVGAEIGGEIGSGPIDPGSES